MKQLILLLALVGVAILVQQAQADVVLDVNQPGCVAKDPNGNPLALAGKSAEMIRIPNGTSFNDACLVDLSLIKKPCLYKGSSMRPDGYRYVRRDDGVVRNP